MTRRCAGSRAASATDAPEEEDTLSELGALPEEFAEAARACLSFAREKPDLLRLLSRKDTEIVVDNVTLLPFKDGVDSVRRMKALLGNDGNDVLMSDQACTTDVMVFLLSYVCNSFGKGRKYDNKHCELVEASVRTLLNGLVMAVDSIHEPITSDSKDTSLRHEQSQQSLMQKIGMKRGDWICPKCSFMNFARNMECLECKEARPRRQLTGEEWECPQCDFFNHGKNMACLRCECKRPERSMRSKNNSENGYLIEGSISTGGAGSGRNTESAIGQRLDRILGRGPATSEVEGTSNKSVIGERGVRNVLSSMERRDPGYVPFVPLPEDMFRKKTTEQQNDPVKEESFTKPGEVEDSVSQKSGSENSDVSLYSKDFNNQTMGKTSIESSDQSERLSSNSLQHTADTNMPSPVMSDDFPEIMPMRKGENRFVVSKKKDCSLTSPQYKRRIAMEQASSSNYVPFVPFPPGYFAKKDKQPEVTYVENSTTETSASVAVGDEKSMSRNGDENKIGEASMSDVSNIQQAGNTRAKGSVEAPSLVQLAVHDNVGSLSSEPSQEVTAGTSGLGGTTKSPQNGSESGIQVFTGKSLEGSAVTEPDPLDMSEEAKAQRWFRRVAQINDISELSKIPDEDFPEIMPMRKGVNRFVVSKRKTPLERRLTSLQYRRNLPVVSSSERETDFDNNAQES